MPDLPLLIFDGRCAFCGIWIEYWKRIASGRLAFAPSQEVRPTVPANPARALQDLGATGPPGRQCGPRRPRGL